MAIISRVASSVYSPSTSAKQPSLNSPSPGSSLHSVSFDIVSRIIDKTY